MLRLIKSMPPVTKNLIIINFLVWLAMALFPATIGLKADAFLGLHYYESPLFNPAQLLTYMFIHDHREFFHVFFNMFTLFFFGASIEYNLGSRRFLLYYLACGVGAGLIQEAVWALTLPPQAYIFEAYINGRAWLGAYTVGASGAIYGVLLAFAMLYPNRPIYFIFLPVPIKAKWMVLIWGGLELVLGMSSASDGIAHFAHLGGMIFGFMLMAYWIKKGTVYRE
ncbi:MAG: rhomboid family intramembrane serine protease [Paramuribaculum sp.]|nr:rhomboid family intramembrane serine protease [Paramuribaculum sp.]